MHCTVYMVTFHENRDQPPLNQIQFKGVTTRMMHVIAQYPEVSHSSQFIACTKATKLTYQCATISDEPVILLDL